MTRFVNSVDRVPAAFVALLALTQAPAFSISTSAVEIINARKIRDELQLSRYTHPRDVKIAIIGNALRGNPDRYLDGKTLPANAVIVTQYEAEQKPGTAGVEASVPLPLSVLGGHALQMAQIVWSVSGGDAEGPRLYLLKGAEHLDFVKAVRYAVEQKVDIILNTQNWEAGGNYDGEGWVNALVSEATDQGILWVQAAGNDHGSVYNGAIPEGLGEITRLRLSNTVDENNLEVVLTWNDFDDAGKRATTQDLDLYLYNPAGDLVAKSELQQVPSATPAEGSAERGKASKLAREMILDTQAANLPRTREGEFYTLEIRARAGKFDANSRMRVVVRSKKSPGSLRLREATLNREIMIPADHPGVITVGDAISGASSHGPTMDGRVKPEIVIENSRVASSEGTESVGTSNAAAIFTAVVATLKGHARSKGRDLTRERVLEMARRIDLGGELGERERCGYRGLVSRNVWDDLRRFGGVEMGEVDILRETGDLQDERVILGFDANPLEFREIYADTARDAKEHGRGAMDYLYFITPRVPLPNGWPDPRPGAPGQATVTYAIRRDAADSHGLPPSPRPWIEIRDRRAYPPMGLCGFWRTPRPEAW